MRAKTLAAILLLVACSVLWQVVSVFFSYRPITNYPPKGERIVVLGDSLSEGVGASSPENGYVGILERRIGVTIINKGVSGDTVGAAKNRLESDVLNENPDIVMILLGGNDAIRRTPREEVFLDLREIITRVHEKGAVVLLVGVQGSILGDRYKEGFADLAEETGAAFVPDILDGIIGVPSLMSDTIHPNDAGYLKMADRIAPTLNELVWAAREYSKVQRSGDATPSRTTVPSRE